MRLLVVSQMDIGGNGPEKVAAINGLGFETAVFDVLPFARSGSRLSRSISHRFNIGTAITRMNAGLLKFAAPLNYDAVWVDKGTWIFPQTLEEIKKNSTMGVAIHYTPDAQIHDNRSRHFLNGIGQYDLLVTTKRAEINDYYRAGAADVLFIQQGYGTKFHPNAGTAKRRGQLAADVVFIGRNEPHYSGLLRMANQATDELRIWGPTWPSYAKRHPWARQAVHGAGLWGEDYPAALGASKIALGLLTKRSNETVTTRSFEIPASGGFLLAERSSEHEELFEEGSEAVFFDTGEEMNEKIRFYIKNDTTRNLIAAAGRERCLKSGYDTQSQFRRIFDHATRNFDFPVPL